MPSLPGRSVVSVMTDAASLPKRPLYYLLFNNYAVMYDNWRLVTAYGQPWQLYDLKNDRTETHDLAAERPDKLKEMLALQAAFYESEKEFIGGSAGSPEPSYTPLFDEKGGFAPPKGDNVPNPEYPRLVSTEQLKGERISDLDLEAIKEQAAEQRLNKPAAPNRGSRQNENEDELE